MSDDHNPTPDAVLETPIPNNNDTQEDTTENATLNNTETETPEARKKRHLAVEKLSCLKHLAQSLDGLVYTELIILYYMDCSFFRLFLRAVSQFFFFTPLILHGAYSTMDRPYIPGILLTNLLCLFLHLFTAQPSAGEITRGYLHGGIIMDLIGQKGPTSKLHMIFLDLLVLGLQGFLLCVHTEYKILQYYIKNKEYRKALGSRTSESGNGSQDHDAEERGVFRLASTTSDGIELQETSQQTQRRTENSSSEDNIGSLVSGSSDDTQGSLRSNILLDARLRQDSLDEWLSLHHAGVAVVAEFHVIETLKKHYWIDKASREIRAAVEASGSETRASRLASVSDILARAMENRNGQEVV